MHEHDHDHDDHAPITQAHDSSPYAKRAWAIQSLLVEKGCSLPTKYVKR